MVFSSVLFLFYFLPAQVLLYYLSPRALRNSVALLGSLLFYAWGAPLFVYVLLAGTLIDYRLSLTIAAREAGGRKPWLWCSIVLNVGLLLYFKYANFFVDQVNLLLQHLGWTQIAWTAVALPIGISFFTFHKISYVVDVYRGTASPARSFADCLLYFVLFPQLIAGPIIRYHDVDSQIRGRAHSPELFWSGVERFVLGLVKKSVIANTMAAICDPVLQRPPAMVPQAFAWLAAAAYYFQIYFDFSGYSDMALGLGRMLGFRWLENFDRPYLATTFTDFWRRWHISLSNFMREYLYIPLGGNRTTPLRAYRNLWIVFLVSGFWHGASWNFVLWGAYQGVFLTIDKLGWLRIAQRVPAFVLRPVMVLLVMISWVIFSTRDLSQCAQLLQRMFCGGGPGWAENEVVARVPLDAYAISVLGIAATVSFLPWSAGYRVLEQRLLAWARTPVGAPVATAIVLLGLLVGCLAVVNSTYNPFIYFRF
jgi:alginate O-acetyltransferase complex protein AlgI